MVIALYIYKAIVLLLANFIPRLVDLTSLHKSRNKNKIILIYSKFMIFEIKHLKQLLSLLLVYLMQKKEND